MKTLSQGLFCWAEEMREGQRVCHLWAETGGLSRLPPWLQGSGTWQCAWHSRRLSCWNRPCYLALSPLSQPYVLKDIWCGLVSKCPQCLKTSTGRAWKSWSRRCCGTQTPRRTHRWIGSGLRWIEISDLIWVSVLATAIGHWATDNVKCWIAVIHKHDLSARLMCVCGGCMILT